MSSRCAFCRQADLDVNRLSAGNNRADDSVSISRSDTGQVVDVQKEIKYGKPLRVSVRSVVCRNDCVNRDCLWGCCRPCGDYLPTTR